MTDRLEQIFTRQLEYYNSLREVIEVQNGLLFWEYPLTWDDREQQEHLRVLAWRLTEELIEALNSTSSLLEELADCLHFVVELSLAAGVSQAELFTGIEYASLDIIGEEDSLAILFDSVAKEFDNPLSFALRVYRTIDLLGQTMNHLRQRPWRRENRPSSRKSFVVGLSLVFKSFIDTVSCGYNPEDLYHAYFLKSKINDERQKPLTDKFGALRG